MGACTPLKYHYSYRFFTYSVRRKAACKRLASRLKQPDPRGWVQSALKTVSGGEFDWGGTSVKR